MKGYCLVEVPMLSVKSIREAEPGMELEEAAFNREGRVIAEEGEVLTENRIEKLKNLNVRKIVTLDSKTQWIPEDDLETLDGDPDVKERKEFSEATGEIVESLRENHTIENLRKTALHLRRQAHHAGDEEGVGYLDDLIDRTHQLEQEIEDLKNRLEQVEDEEAREELLDTLEGKVRQVDEAMLNLAAPDSMIRETIDTVQEKEQVRFDLTEFIMDKPDLAQGGVTEVEVEDFHEVEQHDASWVDSLKYIGEGELLDGIDSFIESVRTNSQVPDRLTNEFENLKEEFRREKEVKTELLNQMESLDLDGEDYDLVKGVIEGEVSLRKSKLFDLPISDAFARRMFEFMQNQLDRRHRLWERGDRATEGELSDLVDKSKFIDNSLQTETSYTSQADSTDSTTEESPAERSEMQAELSDGAIGDTVEAIRRSGPREGASEFLEKLDQAENVVNRDIESIEQTQQKLGQIEDEKETIAATVKDHVGDEDLRDHVLDVLWRRGDFEPEEFMKLDVPRGILEQVVENLLDEMNLTRSLWSKLEQVSDSSGSIDNSIHDRKDELESKLDRTVEVLSETSHDETSSLDSDQKTDQKTDPDETAESLRVFVNNAEPYEVANRFDLSVSTVQSAQQLLTPPADMNAEQQQYCDPLITEAHKIFYGRELDDDSLEQLAFSLVDKLADYNRILKILLDPPSGDRYLLSHGVNTCLVALRLAEYFDLGSSDLLDLAAASLSLDFGMVEIPTGLWVKNDELSQRADQEVKKHPLLSGGILERAVNGDETITELVEQHHERADGSGYPQGLEKQDQHELSRLLSVADAYVAMLEERPYRNGMQPDQALKTLLSERERYDSEAVRAIIKRIGIYPDGCVVLLSDKRLSLVQSQNPDSPTNPTVLVITDTERNRLDSPVREDLSESNTSVEKIVKR